jgi:hypothetical protein
VRSGIRITPLDGAINNHRTRCEARNTFCDAFVMDVGTGGTLMASPEQSGRLAFRRKSWRSNPTNPPSCRAISRVTTTSRGFRRLHSRHRQPPGDRLGTEDQERRSSPDVRTSVRGRRTAHRDFQRRKRNCGEADCREAKPWAHYRHSAGGPRRTLFECEVKLRGAREGQQDV